MEDGSNYTMSSTDRLACLKKHQHAWDNLQYSSKFIVPLQQGNVWELYGGVLAQGLGSHSLVFTQLPSEIRGIALNSWKIEALPFEMRDFAIDPTQNLLVVIEQQQL